MSPKQATLTLAAATLVGAGFGAVVAINTGDGQQAVEVSYEDIQRLGRDHAEAQRKAAQDAGDDALRQSWLLERRLFESIISLRELRKAVWPPKATPAPEPDPPPTVAGMPADAPLGAVGSIGWNHAGDKVVAYTSARMAGGYRALMNCHRTDTGEVVAFTWALATDADQADYSMVLWIDYEPGVTYQIQAWTVAPDGTEGEAVSATFKIDA